MQSSISGSYTYSSSSQGSYASSAGVKSSVAAAATANSVDDKLDLSSAALSLLDKNAKGRVNNNTVAKVQVSAELKATEQKIKTGNEVIESLDAILAGTAAIGAESVGAVVDVVV